MMRINFYYERCTVRSIKIVWMKNPLQKNPSTTAVISIYFIHCMKCSGKRVFTFQFAFESGNLHCIPTIHDEAEASYRELMQRSSSVIARVRFEARNAARVKLAAFAINRAYIRRIVVIFLIAIPRSSSHFPDTVFLGTLWYLTSRSLSVTAI